MLRKALSIAVVLGAVAAAPVARAQDSNPPPDDSMVGAPAAGGADGTGDAAPGNDAASVEGSAATGVPREATDPHEDPEKGYIFAGIFYRQVFVPKFLLNLFLDQSTGTSTPGVGAEVTYRKAGFDITGSLWWQNYTVTGPFRGAGHPDTDTAILDSHISMMYAAASFMWSTPFNDMFALEYGLDIGIGLVLGDAYRTEAYPSSQAGSIDGYAACAGPGVPNPAYCDPSNVPDNQSGGHYHAKSMKWSDGGSWPNVWLWAAIPHIALRFEPIHQFMMRVEGGFSTGGFFFGAAANYGF